MIYKFAEENFSYVTDIVNFIESYDRGELYMEDNLSFSHCHWEDDKNNPHIKVTSLSFDWLDKFYETLKNICIEYITVKKISVYTKGGDVFVEGGDYSVDLKFFENKEWMLA